MLCYYYFSNSFFSIWKLSTRVKWWFLDQNNCVCRIYTVNFICFVNCFCLIAHLLSVITAHSLDMSTKTCCATSTCHSVASQIRVGGSVQAALGTGGLANSVRTTLHLETWGSLGGLWTWWLMQIMHDVIYISLLASVVTGQAGLPRIRAGKSAEEVTAWCGRAGNNSW